MKNLNLILYYKCSCGYKNFIDLDYTYLSIKENIVVINFRCLGCNELHRIEYEGDLDG